MNVDELELALRGLPGVVAVGFTEADGVFIVELQAGAETYDELARDATVLAARHATGPVAVELVRWGDGEPPQRETRLRMVELTTDPAAGELTVRLARGDEEAVGRASTTGGLPAAVEATVYAVRAFLPELTHLPGWARTVETTPDRRGNEAHHQRQPASVQDPRHHIAPKVVCAEPMGAAGGRKHAQRRDAIVSVWCEEWG
jgi:hypothetical protein